MLNKQDKLIITFTKTDDEALSLEKLQKVLTNINDIVLTPEVGLSLCGVECEFDVLLPGTIKNAVVDIKLSNDILCEHCDDTGEIPIPHHGFAACPYCGDSRGKDAKC